MVSLNYEISTYPEVMLVNSVFPGILKKNNTRNIPIVYISTQRVGGILNNQIINKWLKTAHNFILKLINENNYEYIILLKECNNFFNINPLPCGINIYEATKLLGEMIMNHNGIILRVSSVYGPHCSSRRTIGRMVFNSIVGLDHIEKEEIRDYIFNNDLSDVLYKLIIINTNITEYCASGETMSKTEIRDKINNLTHNSNGKTEIFTDRDGKIENYQPDNTWFQSVLGRKSINIEEGLQMTTKFTEHKYKKEPTTTRLNGLYDNINQQSNESGISTKKVEELKSQFFKKKNGKWSAEESLWKPTGLVFGYPYSTILNQNIDQIKKEVVDTLKLNDKDYWSIDRQHRHTTLVSYTYFSEVGNSTVQLPVDQYDVAEKIIKKYSPITIKYKGIVITTNGAVLLKGFVEDEQIFSLRKELLHSIAGITQRPQLLAHSTLMYILKDISYEKISEINSRLHDKYIGKTIFKSVTTPSGKKFNLKKTI